MRAVIVWVAILGAEQNGASGQHHGGLKEQRRRRTDQDIGVRPRAFRQTIEQRPDLGEVRAQAMHLPIAGDERPDCTHCNTPVPILNPRHQAIDACGEPLCSLENGALPPQLPLPMMRPPREQFS